MVLTTAPAVNPVTIDVLPQITRTYNSKVAFVPEANFGEGAAVQIQVSTPTVLVELHGTPAVGQTWTLILNGVAFSYQAGGLTASYPAGTFTLQAVARRIGRANKR
jgi:hypothetical protein